MHGKQYTVVVGIAESRPEPCLKTEDEMSTGSRVWVVGFALAFALAACSADSDVVEGTPPEGQAGTAGAACYPNGTCNAGLECKAGTCITNSFPA